MKADIAEIDNMFQHTAARRRLPPSFLSQIISGKCFNTQPREGGCPNIRSSLAYAVVVSTHSRAKAAAISDIQDPQSEEGFNTQPREGGCELV